MRIGRYIVLQVLRSSALVGLVLVAIYSAIDFVSTEAISEINQALCKGCGTCVAACPAQAIAGAHFSNEQVQAEIEGILWDRLEPEEVPV